MVIGRNLPGAEIIVLNESDENILYSASYVTIALTRS